MILANWSGYGPAPTIGDPALDWRIGSSDFGICIGVCDPSGTRNQRYRGKILLGIARIDWPLALASVREPVVTVRTPARAGCHPGLLSRAGLVETDPLSNCMKEFLRPYLDALGILQKRPHLQPRLADVKAVDLHSMSTQVRRTMQDSSECQVRVDLRRWANCSGGRSIQGVALSIDGQISPGVKLASTNDENSKCLRANHAVGEALWLFWPLFHWYPF